MALNKIMSWKELHMNSAGGGIDWISGTIAFFYTLSDSSGSITVRNIVVPRLVGYWQEYYRLCRDLGRLGNYKEWLPLCSSGGGGVLAGSITSLRTCKKKERKKNCLHLLVTVRQQERHEWRRKLEINSERVFFSQAPRQGGALPVLPSCYLFILVQE